MHLRVHVHVHVLVHMHMHVHAQVQRLSATTFANGGDEALEEGPRSELDEQMEQLEKEVREVLAEVKAVDQALKEQLRDLNQQVAMTVLGTLMVDLKRTYAEHPSVGAYLQAVQKDIVDNIEHFRETEEQPTPIPGLRLPRQEPDFSRYEINVVVDNSHTEGAPVV
ncbi:MAG: hypothetical protein VX385_05650, partial [Acidobacteriota bacterium]|nr:hypothetical protein [Acidobacteriota bacterium]